MHPGSRRKAGEGIPAHHAHVSRAGHGRAGERSGRIYQVNFGRQARGKRKSHRQRYCAASRSSTTSRSGAMSMEIAIPQPVERENYLNKKYGVWSWLLTTDHKRISLLYLISITFFFFIGGFFALLIRLELLTPAGRPARGRPSNQLFTLPRTGISFFFIPPSLPPP